MFKQGKQYSNTNIQKKLSNIETFGAVEGGKHIIQGTDSNGTKYTFKMRLNDAWRGGKAIYYDCVEVAHKKETEIEI